MERTRSWKVSSWKVLSWKVWPNLERAKRSWKEPSEVGNRFPNHNLELMMNFPTSITTFQVHSNFITSARTFQLQRNFPTSQEAFQLRSILSNFTWFFPTSIGSFQLRLALSNFRETFQLQTFQLPFPTTRIRFENWLKSV